MILNLIRIRFNPYKGFKPIATEIEAYATAKALVSIPIRVLSRSRHGYLSRRRIGSVLTDGSSLIRGFAQQADTFRWNPQLASDFIGVLSTSTANLQTLSVPPGLVVQPILNIASSTNGVYVFCGTPGSPSSYPVDLAASVSNVLLGWSIYTNTARQVRFHANATVTVDLLTQGWIDPLL